MTKHAGAELSRALALERRVLIMARRVRNFKNAVMSVKLTVGDIRDWGPPTGLSPAMRGILECEGIRVTRATIIQPRHLVRMQEEYKAILPGSWMDWLIRRIVRGKKTELSCLKSLIKEVRKPRTLRGLRDVISSRLSGRDLFETLIGIEVGKNKPERELAKILIAYEKSMSPKQVYAIIDGKLRGDREAFYWAIESSTLLNHATKVLLANPEPLSGLKSGESLDDERGKSSVLDDKNPERDGVPKPYQVPEI
jgi:hypothetical protein